MSTVGGAASDLERRLAALSPAQRKLLELRLAKRRHAAEPAARPSGIPRVPEAASYPLSVDQERIYFIHQLTPDSPFYNIYDVGRMRGPLDHAVLLAALREVVRRHEILRTRFLTLDGEPRQVVEPRLDVVLGEVDLRGLPAERIRVETDRQVAALLQRPFDLAQLPLCRSMIFRLAEDERVWPMVFHHIVTDWISNFAVRGELVALYSALVEGRPSPLPELPCQYRDYSVWQRQQLESEALARQTAFWREHLRDAPHDTELPLDRPRPRIPNAVGARHPLELSTRDSDRLRQLAQRRGATLFMSFVALFKVLVLRMTGQERLIVGSPMVSRNHPDLEHLLGFFLHQLVFYTDLGGDPGFGEALGRVRKSTVGAFSNKDVPFGQVVELVGPERDLGRMPLTQLNFLFLNPHQIDPGLFPGVEYLPYRFDGESSKFDVTFVVWDHGDRMDGLVEYDVGLFDHTTISRLIRGYQNLLAAVVDDSDRPLSQLSLLAPAERHQLAVEWNGPGWDARRVSSPHGEPEGVVAALVRNAAEHPEAVALRWQGTTIDYGTLATAVGGLAAHLEAAGVGPEVVVGVWIDRRPEMLVSLLAIWAAGGAYLPLDPSYPEERVAFMVEDSGAELVLVASSCQAARTHPVPSPPSPLSRGRERGDQNPQTSSRQGRHNIASDFSHSRPGPAFPPAFEVPPLASIPAAPADWRPRRVDGDVLAYLIYTSGSTGRPKGVAIGRRSVDLCVATLLAELPSEAWRGVLASTSISFDVSVAELFPPLVAGGTVVLAGDVLALSTLAERETVRMVSTVPSAMAALLRQGPLPPSATTVVLAGEPLRRTVADAVFDAVFDAVSEEEAEGLRLFDFYGPTEDTVYATGAEVRREPGEPTIGRPLAPGRSHAVDRRGRLAALGAEAELWLGGPGLARGYHRRPGLTAERFVPDPWSEEPGARLYRTGDRVRYRVDGELDHLGRLDHQVKVRGFRVELGEIENALEQQPGVVRAVVLAQGSAGSDGRRLVAHVAGADLDPGTLRRALETMLPAHLVPSALRVVESLPVLPNGKIDRKGLSRIVVGGEDSVGQAIPPRTALEEILLAIYREVLGLGDAPVGVESSFFALGGHSLLAVQVAARLRERLSVELPMRTLFEAPTVAALAARVETLQGVDDEAPPLTARPDGPGSPAPLAYAQERLWFLDRLMPEDPSYNMPAVLDLRGELDVAALSAALLAVVARHEALRTRFVEIGARVEQRIDPPSLRASLPVVDLEALPVDRRGSVASALGRSIAARPFDLAQGPIWRAHLVRRGDAAHQLHLVVHHIVADAWSQGLWVRELGEIYRAALDSDVEDRGHALTSPLGPAPLQLADVAVWQRQWLQGEALDRRIDFWRQRLTDTPVLELPSDRPRRALTLRRGRTRTVRLDGELHGALRSLAAGRGATLFMVLLTGYATLLARLAGQPEVVVGTPVAGRRRRTLEDVFGFFVNTLALRCDLRDGDDFGAPGFGELVARLREVTLAADAQQDVPFEKVVAELDPERSLTTTPLVQAMLVLQNLPPAPLELPGLTLEARPIDSGTAKFDLTLMLTEMPDGSLEGLVESDRELFDATTIERWWRSFESLLRHAATEPETPVDRLDLLAAAEQQQVLWEWTSWTGGEGVESRAELPRAQPWPSPPSPLSRGRERGGPEGSGGASERSIPDAVAHWARHDPEAIAVEGEGADGAWTQRTYGELVSRSRGLADRLVALGVQRGERVGVCAERTVDLVVALLGVLEAGAAYLPLDPTLPRQRLAFQLADAGARWVVAPAELEDRLGGVTRRLWLEESSPASEVTPTTTRATGGDLAYVIYTSGSTGRPKGVLVPHGHVDALMEATAPWFGFGPGDVWSCFHSHGFDFSVWEIWGCLTTGGRLVMVPYWTSRSPADFRRLLAERGVTVVSQTPSAFRQLLATDLDGSARVSPSVRMVVLGGEAFEPSAVPGWFEHCAALGTKAPELVNLYGITETTVHVTVRPITSADPDGAINSPVGLAIPDQRVRLLDRRGRPVPPGSAGEIHVGGGRLAWGYLGRPGLTAERFVPDTWGAPGSRCYRSGDLARQRPSGELDFLGRIDHQVKVRGFRIELGEIEAALVSQPEVSEAVVLPRGQGLDVELVGFVVGTGDLLSPLDLRDRLRSHLPDSMVPSAIVVVEALPLTANGKLDRRALAGLEVDPGAVDGGAVEGNAWIAPRTPTEALVAEIFSEVLAVERVGAEADFFRLGGHSLLATQVVSRLAERLDTPIRLRQLFEHRTVASLAAVLPPPSSTSELEPRPADARGGVVPQASPSEDPQVAPLSFAQERLFILDRLEPGNPAYHMPFALRFRGRLDTVGLEHCWRLLLARHALLRVTFGLDDGRPVQRLGSVDDRPWPWIDLRSLPRPRREDELDRLGRWQAHAPFDLATGPVLRALGVRLAAADHALLFNLHHIAGDGWSVAVLTRELGVLYRAWVGGGRCDRELAAELPTLPLDPLDHARRQRRWLEGPECAQQVDYWRAQLAELPTLDLPTDHPRPTVRRFRPGRQTLELDLELSAALGRLAKDSGATPFMVLLTGFVVLLGRLAGQHDVAVGTPVAGRSRRDVEGLVGIFLNTLVLRSDLSGGPSFAEALGRTRARVLDALDHQDVPFERLLDTLGVERDLSRTPLFQVFFNMLNLPVADLELGQGHLAALEMPDLGAKFDLTLYADDRRPRWRFELIYDRGLFGEARMALLLAQLEAVYRQAVASPELAITTLDLRVAEGRHAPALPDPSRPLDTTWRGPVHRWVAERSAESPARIAIESPEGRWTYGELVSQSHRLAHALLAAGLRPGEPVAIVAHRSAALVWTVLGTLAAGGVFVLLDPAYPAARQIAILRKARPAALLRLRAAGPLDAEVAAVVDGLDFRLDLELAPWCESSQTGPLASQPTTAPEVELGPDDPAALGFTSGSTGEPKGIVGRHGPLTHFLPWQCETFDLRPDDRYSLLSGLAHDPIQRDLFTSLATGATLCLPEPDTLLVPGALAAWMATAGITVAHLTPAMAQVVASTGSDTGGDGAGPTTSALRRVFLTGDALTPRDVAGLERLAPGVRCFNFYGSTETQRAVGFSEATSPAEAAGGATEAALRRVLPLGRGMEGAQLLVVTAAGALAGVGELGEIWVRSPHLARGYLDAPRATAERFAGNPWGAGEAWDRVYRTGDLGRYRPDGQVEFAGRADQQVQIRGVRVELGEIETRLLDLSGVAGAVVLAQGAPGSQRLAAAVVAEASVEPEIEALRRSLRRELPEALVPTAWVVLDALPMTPNGKLDRRELLRRMESAGPSTVRGSTPQGALEETLAGVFGEILGVSGFGRDDNFFDLGGNSLLLVRAHERIERRLERSIPALALFQYPTVRTLADHLAHLADGAVGSAPIERRPRQLQEGQSRQADLRRRRLRGRSRS